MELTPDIMKNFRPLHRITQPFNERINSIDYSPDGDRLLVGTDDDIVHVFDGFGLDELFHQQTRKYGCELVRYVYGTGTSSYDCCLHASNKTNHDVRLLSLANGQYLRYFKHEARVCDLAVNYEIECFLSAAVDRSVRLWDYGMEKAAASMLLDNVVRLFDLRAYDKGPFSKLEARRADGKPADGQWTGIRFSPDGNTLILTGNSARVLLINAFHGRFEGELSGFASEASNAVGLSGEASPVPLAVTPCSSFVVMGSSDGRLHVFDTRTEHVSFLTTLEHVADADAAPVAAALAPATSTSIPSPSASASATPAAGVGARVIDCVAFHPSSAVLAFASHAPAGKPDPDLCFFSAPHSNHCNQ